MAVAGAGITGRCAAGGGCGTPVSRPVPASADTWAATVSTTAPPTPVDNTAPAPTSAPVTAWRGSWVRPASIPVTPSLPAAVTALAPSAEPASVTAVTTATTAVRCAAVGGPALSDSASATIATWGSSASRSVVAGAGVGCRGTPAGVSVRRGGRGPSAPSPPVLGSARPVQDMATVWPSLGGASASRDGQELTAVFRIAPATATVMVAGFATRPLTLLVAWTAMRAMWAWRVRMPVCTDTRTATTRSACVTPPVTMATAVTSSVLSTELVTLMAPASAPPSAGGGGTTVRPPAAPDIPTRTRNAVTMENATVKNMNATVGPAGRERPVT